jgi:hypothetical protein
MAKGDTAGLSSLISSGTLTKFADDPSSLSSPAALEQGRSLVSNLFGSSDLTQLISTVAEKTGVSSSVINSILPIAASLLGGLLSKRTSEGHNLTDVVDQVASVGHGGVVEAVKSLAAKMFG